MHIGNFREGHFKINYRSLLGEGIMIQSGVKSKSNFFLGERYGYTINYSNTGKIISEGYMKKRTKIYEMAIYKNYDCKNEYFKELNNVRIKY